MFTKHSLIQLDHFNVKWRVFHDFGRKVQSYVDNTDWTYILKSEGT